MLAGVVALPTDIEHSVGGNTLRITWDDGIVSTLPIPYLRAWCPCAACQGHGVEVRFQENVGDDVRASELHEIGAYALGIRFSDGHDSGLFSWTWLRQICPTSEPLGLKRGSFTAGRFH
jgi:DUF971 family protein